MIAHQGPVSAPNDPMQPLCILLYSCRCSLPERIFSHPDCTVGSGIGLASPDQLTLADYTAGRELPPALKNDIFFYGAILYPPAPFVNYHFAGTKGHAF